MAGKRRSLLKLLALFSALMLAGALQGCREEEQGRIILPDKGEYRGVEDPPLAPEQVDELRSRAGYQRI